MRWLEADVLAGGRVQASSLQGYLSPINRLHRDLGLAEPAVGSFLQSYRAGVAHTQTSAGRECERAYLPAQAIEQMHEAALCQPVSTAADRGLLRARVATVLSYIFFARGATS